MNFPGQKNGPETIYSVWGVQRYVLNLEIPKLNFLFFQLSILMLQFRIGISKYFSFAGCKYRQYNLFNKNIFEIYQQNHHKY